MKIPYPYKNYPENYEKFSELIRSNHNARQIGFQTDNDKVFRFTNRFRLAKEFVEIKFDTYRNNTADGYTSLFKVFLVYSAFELFLETIGEKQSSITVLISPYKPTDYIAFFLNKDKTKQFYDFLYNHLDRANHKNNLMNVCNGKSSNVTYIASSIRHIFAHGHLSAHANQCNPQIVKEICDKIFEFHIKVMDNEFTKMIESYRNSL